MLLVLALVASALSPTLCEGIFKINITPEEAQQYLEKSFGKSSSGLSYGDKIGENAVPESYDDKGNFVYQGRKLENPQDYVEEHYIANQYHGQDGLGKYSFGYKDWNQARAETKNGNGEIKGTYKYVRPNGQDLIVNYWADSEGFHHEDNRPKVELKPATDSPIVKAAKEEFFSKWKEAAEANGVKADLRNVQFPKSVEGQYQSNGAESKYVHIEPKYEPSEEELKYEPKGFYYEFDYKTPLLRNIHEREETQRLRSLNNH